MGRSGRCGHQSSETGVQQMKPVNTLYCIVIVGLGACHRGGSSDPALSAGGPNNGGAASVAGRVMDTSTHDGLQGATADLMPSGANSASVTGGSSATDRTGEFMINNVVAGQYDLRVNHAGYTGWSTTIRVGVTGSQKFSISLTKSVTPCVPPRAPAGRQPVACP
jgi:hypothetical protein